MNKISTIDLLHLLFKNIVIVILCAIIGGVGAFVYCKNFTDEKFLSKGSILVTNGGLITDKEDGPVNNTDIAASINLLPTLMDLLKSTNIYKSVSKEIGNKYTPSQLMNAVSVSSTDEHSLLLSISFELNSKEDVKTITDTFLKASTEYIETRIPGSSAAIINSASNPVKTAPKTLTTTVICAMLAALICYGVVFVIYTFNSTIQSADDFSAKYDIPVLGNIPDFSTNNSTKSTSKKAARR